MKIIHIAYSPQYRLHLSDNRYVYMAWHHYCGPEFYWDKCEERVIENWWEDEGIIEKLEWFIKRGERA